MMVISCDGKVWFRILEFSFFVFLRFLAGEVEKENCFLMEYFLVRFCVLKGSVGWELLFIILRREFYLFD